MKLISRIFLASLIGLVLAFGFAFWFLDLFTRPILDQVLLLVLPAAAFGYLGFFALDLSWRRFKESLKISISTAEVLAFLRVNRAGFLLAILFFFIYFYVALQLNPAHVDTVDNFLDADNSSWMHRLADPGGHKIEMRGPHPFAYLILRPFGLLLYFFTRDVFLSAILLNTLAGALCVFLTWFYFKRHTQSTIYALLIASLLGMATSHFFFGSVVETYIFSALLLITFFVLLQRNESSLGGLVFASLITFGITLTNFVQTWLGFVVSRPRIKEIIRFSGLVISFSVIFSLVQAALYPSSKLFFLPSDAQAEEEFAFSPFNEPSWRVIGRVVLLIRTIFLYTVVAPQPYVFTTEVGGTFPRFNFFKIAPEIFSYSSYHGWTNLLIIVWAIILFLAGLLFLIDLFRTRKIDIRLSFIFCILFNFILHLYYGYEPFLYSPDWAYALIFFVGVSFSRFSTHKIFQVGLTIFLLFLLINQWQFFNYIFTVIAPFMNR